MLDTDVAVNRELQRLRKLPENRVCPNCLKEDRIGFKSVCVTFQTFVCNECKSAHQSFSHRVKSVDMSVWKLEEVQALERRNGGGNRSARKRWFATLPEADRPTAESTLDQYKKFIQEAYIEQRWAAPTRSASHDAARREKKERRRQRRSAVEDKHRRRHRERHNQSSPHEDVFPTNELHQAYPDVMWPDGFCFPMEGADTLSNEFKFELDRRSTNSCDERGRGAGPGSDSASSPFYSPSLSHHSSLPGHGPQSANESLYHSPISSVAVSNPWTVTAPIDATNPWADALLKHALLLVSEAA